MQNFRSHSIVTHISLQYHILYRPVLSCCGSRGSIGPEYRRLGEKVVMQGTKATLTAVSAASSGGCNRSVGSFVWLTNSLLFYASHRGIVVYDVDRRQSLATLLGHQGAVTCVDGVALGADGADRGDAVFWLVSGSADGAVVMWEVAVASDGACRARAVSQVETVGPVTGVCCCRGDNPPARDETERETWRKLLVAAASGDGGGTVRVFGLSAEGLRVLETVHVGTLVACVCLVWDGCADMSSSRSSTLSPGPDLCVLAGGFVDGSVRLWGLDAARLCDENDSRVGRSAPCVLRDQHQNWVRAIDITWDAGRRRMVMATASQDRYVRVWSLKEDEKGGLGGLDAYAPKPQLRLGARTVAVVCEGLLAGHEDWVHGARFHRSSRGVLTLLTSSMDRTMMMWRREGDHGVGEAGEVGDDQGTFPCRCQLVESSEHFALFEAPRDVSRVAGCQNQCYSDDVLDSEHGAWRTWLYVCCLRTISRPPHKSMHAQMARSGRAFRLWETQV